MCVGCVLNGAYGTKYKSSKIIEGRVQMVCGMVVGLGFYWVSDLPGYANWRALVT